MKVKKILSFIIVACMLFVRVPAMADELLGLSIQPGQSELAEEYDGGEKSVTAEDMIPAGATKYINENYPDIEQAILDFAQEVCGIEDIEALQLCRPYVIYHFSEYQDEIYYYPLASNGKVEFILGLIGTEEGYAYDVVRNDMVNLLNEMDYVNNECIFYMADGELYYEVKGKSGKIPEAGVFYGYATEAESGSAFSAISFDEKSRIIAEKVSNFRPLEGTDDNRTEADFDYKCGTMITLLKPQLQYSFNMCWACVVATIANTLNWTSYTGFDICNRMGIGFNTGAEASVMKTALSYYGVDYILRRDYLSEPDVKKNIDAGYPIAMILYTGNVFYQIFRGIRSH